MKRNWIVGLACAVMLIMTVNAHAVNLVEVPSKSFNPNDTGVEIRVKITNDISINGLTVPIALRTVVGSATITSSRMTYRDRLAPGLPELTPIEITNTFSAEDGTCQGGAGGFHTIFATDTLTHAIGFSPVAFLFFRNALFNPALPAGADVDGSLNLIVDVNAGPGIFEVDTTCTDPANHLTYISESNGQPLVPDFIKGIFTIGNPPVARDTSWSTNEDTPRNVSYLPASDPDNDIQTFAINDGPFHGQVSGFDANTGAFTYTPDPEYSGPDSIKFVAADAIFTSNEATVRITVVEINDPPVAYDTALVTDEDTPVNGMLFGSDIDGPGALTFEITANPTKGDITSFDANTGAFTYNPDLNYNGTDQFIFRTRDGITVSPGATAHITINPINDPPVARDSSVTVQFETPVNARFQASDVDGPSILFSQLTGPFHGTFTGFDSNTGIFTYTPDSAFSGADSITFDATDGLLTSDPGTIRINVSASNCVCANWGDPARDGQANILDVNRIIDIIFFNFPPSVSLYCPLADADVNCDCSLDVIDLNVIVGVAFFNQEFTCNPCAATCLGSGEE